MSHITVHIKSLSGEVLSLEVPSEMTPTQLVNQLTSLHPEEYPLGRTVLLREEEKDALREGEVVGLFVVEKVQKETGRFPIGGKPYTRLIIPFAGQMLYLYLTDRHNYRTMEHGVNEGGYGASLSPLLTKPSETYQSESGILYVAIHRILPEVTPAQMAYLYEIVFDEWEKLEEERGLIFTHTFSPFEPMECGCGSIVQRKGLSAHQRSVKHKTWQRSQ